MLYILSVKPDFLVVFKIRVQNTNILQGGYRLIVSYHEQIDLMNKAKLSKQLELLPPYCSDFFRGIEMKTASATRIAYAYDLRRFFRYLIINTEFNEIREIPLEYLEQLPLSAFEKYIEFLKYEIKNESICIINKNSGISRKISTLKTFYAYMVRTLRISHDPTIFLSLPKIPPKDIIRLEPEEVVRLLNSVESGEYLSIPQRKYHDKTKKRDLALLTLLLGTGIRISECIGLNISDIDFNVFGINIHRKGGKEVTVYFGEEVNSSLLSYLDERKEIEAGPGHEQALFLSMRKTRISISAAEKLVKKYSHYISPNKKITPHKLRSTYGTSLYRVTGDIYLVADVLGHSDVNTTRKHYAAIEDDRRRNARNAVKLRK